MCILEFIGFAMAGRIVAHVNRVATFDPKLNQSGQSLPRACVGSSKEASISCVYLTPDIMVESEPACGKLR